MLLAIVRPIMYALWRCFGGKGGREQFDREVRAKVERRIGRGES